MMKAPDERPGLFVWWVFCDPATAVAALGLDPRAVTPERHFEDGGLPNGPRVEPEGSAVFAERLRSRSPRLGAVGRAGGYGVFGPEMAGVAAFEVFGDVFPASAPEAGEVARGLNGTVGWG